MPKQTPPSSRPILPLYRRYGDYWGVVTCVAAIVAGVAWYAAECSHSTSPGNEADHRVDDRRTADRPLLVLSFSGPATNQLDVCRAETAARQVGVPLEMLHGGAGDSALHAVSRRLRQAEAASAGRSAADVDSLVLYLDPASAVALRGRDAVVSAFDASVQRGDAPWLFAASCNCLPWMLHPVGNRTVCGAQDAPTAADGAVAGRFLDAGAWVGELRYVRAALERVLRHEGPDDQAKLLSWRATSPTPARDRAAVDVRGDFAVSMGAAAYPERDPNGRGMRLVRQQGSLLQQCNAAADTVLRGGLVSYDHDNQASLPLRAFHVKTKSTPAILLFPAGSRPLVEGVISRPVADVASSPRCLALHGRHGDEPEGTATLRAAFHQAHQEVLASGTDLRRRAAALASLGWLLLAHSPPRGAFGGNAEANVGCSDPYECLSAAQTAAVSAAATDVQAHNGGQTQQCDEAVRLSSVLSPDVTGIMVTDSLVGRAGERGVSYGFAAPNVLWAAADLYAWPLRPSSACQGMECDAAFSERHVVFARIERPAVIIGRQPVTVTSDDDGCAFVVVPSQQRLMPLDSRDLGIATRALGGAGTGIPFIAAALSPLQMSCWNFAHWLLECLPRLIWLLPELEQDVESVLLVPEDPATGRRPTFVDDALDVLQIDRQRARTYASAKGLKLGRLATVDWRPTDDRVGLEVMAPRAALQLVRSTFAEESKPLQERHTVVFVSRNRNGTADKLGGRRSITNEETVISAVRGVLDRTERLVVFTGEDSSGSLAAAVELFSNARLVLGVHGAGLANAVFCAPGTPLVEIALQEPFYRAYMHLAAALELRYWAETTEAHLNSYASPVTVQRPWRIAALVRRALDESYSNDQS